MTRLLRLLTVWVAATWLCAAAADTPAVTLLLNKARSLEGRGRVDLAVQTWQQVLVTDPNQQDALAGLARAAKLSGKETEARGYLDRLKRVNPSHPAIVQIENLVANKQQLSKLQEAVKLAQAKQYAPAMAIYREVFGEAPPPEWASAYYETEAATPGGWERAIPALRKLYESSGRSQQYQLVLGRLLTYRPATRAEGMQMLRDIPGPDARPAQSAWRQALVWENGSRASLASLRAYLQKYPDAEIAALAAKAQKQPAARAPGLAEGPDLQRGYQELKANRLPEAERSFRAALEKSPQNGGALAGLGYVAMQQRNFADALKFFGQAREALPNHEEIQKAEKNARFWLVLQDATTAVRNQRASEAEDLFGIALQLQPNNVDALQGLAGSLMQNGKISDAIPVLERLTQGQPQNAAAWRTLVNAYYQTRGAAAALAASRQAPAAVAANLNTDIEYMALLASLHRDTGNQQESRRIFEQAIAAIRARRFEVSSGLELQLAGLYLQHAPPLEAAAIYQHAIDNNPESLDAWEGLLAALKRGGAYTRAVALIERLPPASRTEALTRPGFLRAVAGIYVGLGNLATAESLLARSREVELKAGARRPSFYTELQLGQLFVEKGEYDKAVALFTELTRVYPENPECWKSLILSLFKDGRTDEAVDLPMTLPQEVLARLQDDTDYLTLIAAVYSQAGRHDEAMRALRQCNAHYQAIGEKIPADTTLQLGWLLLNSEGNERELLVLLRDLRGRTDLTTAQRKGVSELLATSVLRSADAAMRTGDLEKTTAILAAGLRALPSDERLRRAMAGYFLAAGDSRRAFALYRNAGLKDASAADYVAAVGTALAERDSPTAESWLAAGLKRYPSDPDLLNIAGRQAASKGKFKEAQIFWSAALDKIRQQEQQRAISEARHELRRDSAAPAEHDVTDELGALMLQKGGAAPDKPGAVAPRPTRRIPWLVDPPEAPAPQPGRGAPVKPANSPDAGAPPTKVADGQAPRSSAGVPTAQDVLSRASRTHPAALAPTNVENVLDAPLFQSRPASPPPAKPALPRAGAEPIEPQQMDPQSRDRSIDQQIRELDVRAFLDDDASYSGAPAQTDGADGAEPPDAPASALPDAPQIQRQSSQPADQPARSPAHAEAHVQAGAFKNPDILDAHIKRLLAMRAEVVVKPQQKNGGAVLNRVLVVYDEATILDVLSYLRRQNIDPFIVVHENGSERYFFPETYIRRRKGNTVPAPPADRPTSSPKPPAPEKSSPAAVPANAAAPPTVRGGDIQTLRYEVAPLPGASAASAPALITEAAEQNLPIEVMTPQRRERRPAAAAPKTDASPAKSPAAALDQLIEQMQPRSAAPQGPRPPAPVKPEQTSPRPPAAGAPVPDVSDILAPPRAPQPALAAPSDQEQTPLARRQEIEQQIGVVEARNTPYAGISGYFQARNGQPGFERMFNQESDLEISSIAANRVRFTGILKAISLNTPAPTGESTLRFGLLPAGDTFTPPSVSGLGAEAQISTLTFGMRFGVTPRNFPVRNYVAGLRFRPAGGPITLQYEREPLKDSILAYAGARDPLSNMVWGGVVADTGTLIGNWGDEKSGAYFSLGYQRLTGRQVADNSRVDGTLGVYWRILSTPEGTLTAGANLFGMRYDKNLRYFTLGHGGYFSPQRFVLFGIPINWRGQWKRLEYNASTSIGSQSFSEQSSPFFPTQPSVQGKIGPYYPIFSSSGTNYNVDFRLDYQVSPNWYVGGFVNVNNARFYTLSSLGISVRYSFRQRDIDSKFNVPSLPDWRGKQPFGMP